MVSACEERIIRHFSATLGEFASFVTHMKALAKVSTQNGRAAEVPMIFTTFPEKRRGSSSD